MSSISRAALLVGFLALTNLPAGADEFRQRGAHVHGEGKLGIVVEETALVIEFLAPAVNMVGFEHEPQSAGEQQAVIQANELLHKGLGLFGFPPAASCKLIKASVTTPQWEADGAEEEAGGEEHVNYSARWQYSCGHPQALTFIEPWLFGKLLNMTKLDATVLNASHQRQQAVTGSKQRIRLD